MKTVDNLLHTSNKYNNKSIVVEYSKLYDNNTKIGLLF